MDTFNEDVMVHCVGCTGSENQTCQIVDKLSIMNKLLLGSMSELQERPGASGQLHLEHNTGYRLKISHFDALHLAQYPELLEWLLKTHRCISSATIKPLLDNHTGRTILEALRRNSGIKSLCLDLYEAWALDAASGVMPCLTNVVVLQCDSSMKSLNPISEAFVAALSELLRKSSCLETLRFLGFPLGSASSPHVVHGAVAQM
ncbi:hypothetical protein MTO96_036371 [Rhipicephalus appendiculatus]